MGRLRNDIAEVRESNDRGAKAAIVAIWAVTAVIILIGGRFIWRVASQLSHIRF